MYITNIPISVFSLATLFLASRVREIGVLGDLIVCEYIFFYGNNVNHGQSKFEFEKLYISENKNYMNLPKAELILNSYAFLSSYSFMFLTFNFTSLTA